MGGAGRRCNQVKELAGRLEFTLLLSSPADSDWSCAENSPNNNGLDRRTVESTGCVATMACLANHHVLPRTHPAIMRSVANFGSARTACTRHCADQIRGYR